MTITKYKIDSVDVLSGENDHLRFAVAPGVGGKIISIYNKVLNREFLWRNKNLALAQHHPGTDYETHFWGGIDELLPNDIVESIDGNNYPDHGELWTTALHYEIENEKIIVYGKLPQSGLWVKKTISCSKNSPEIQLDYIIRNESEGRRHFLWKFHAALTISEGDKLVSSARKAKAVHPVSAGESKEFRWPTLDNRDASIVPAKNNTMDFFYLYDIPENEMHLLVENERCRFSYYYDGKVFPYQWYFASYGKFLDHYTVILEPASSMPVSVNEAMAAGQCTVLDKGQEIKTSATIYAGINTKK